MKTSLTIIIPTYNNILGLRSLLKNFAGQPYKIIVVDNEPTREKRYLIESFDSGSDRLAGLAYLPQNHNLGFAKAVNLAAKDSKSKWLVVLNDDIKFENNLIGDLVKIAEEKKLDALSPVLINPDGGIENFGYKVLPFGKIQLLKTIEASQSNQLDGLTAACLLIKAEVFKNLNGFDESFFAYLEDVDFFLRFKDLGFRMAMATVKVFHDHMKTSKTMGNFKARQDMVNWWRLYFKHRNRFELDGRFIMERLRNISGFLKKTLLFE